MAGLRVIGMQILRNPSLDSVYNIFFGSPPGRERSEIRERRKAPVSSRNLSSSCLSPHLKFIITGSIFSCSRNPIKILYKKALKIYTPDSLFLFLLEDFIKILHVFL